MSEANVDPVARRDGILEAILLEVPFDGWTEEALRRGAQMAGAPWQDMEILFPGGVADVVAEFSRWADRAMLRAVEGQNLAEMKVRDRVARLVRARFEALTPHEDAVRRAAAFLALPNRAALGARLLAETVDAIWRAAGDRSTDYNWYTKRGLLAGVVTSTTFYWLDDRSPGKQDSWNFLARRIDDVLRVGKGASQLVSAATWMRPFEAPLRLARALRNSSLRP